MSYFHKLDDALDESEQDQHREKPSAGARLAEFGDRIARAFTPMERSKIDQLPPEPGVAAPYETNGVGYDPDVAPRFPVGPFGYNRSAVDEYIAELERELEQVRNERPAPMSINEEIQRLGEQTASILVVAHDQAHETTRRAQEQADRTIADAAANAVEMIERAKRQLSELDNETDAVWRERIRLLEDARTTGSALVALADEAAERFPEDTKAVEPVSFAQDTEAVEPVGFAQDTEAVEPVGFAQDTEPVESVRFD